MQMYINLISITIYRITSILIQFQASTTSDLEFCHRIFSPFRIACHKNIDFKLCSAIVQRYLVSAKSTEP